MIRLGRRRDTLGVIFDQVGTYLCRDLAVPFCGYEKKSKGVYHFSNEGYCSWFDFTLAIHKLAGINNCRYVCIQPITLPNSPSRIIRCSIKESYQTDYSVKFLIGKLSERVCAFVCFKQKKNKNNKYTAK